jgi:hypothetical protein
MAQRAVLIGLCAALAVAAGAWLLAGGLRDGQAASPVVLAQDANAPARSSAGEIVLAAEPLKLAAPAEAAAEAPIAPPPVASEREVVDNAPRARVMLRGQLKGARGLGAELQVFATPDFADNDSGGSTRGVIFTDGNDDPWAARAVAPTPFPNNPELAPSIASGYAPLFGSPDSLTLDPRDASVHRNLRTLASSPTLALNARADGTVDADLSVFFANPLAIPQQIALRISHANFTTQQITILCRTADGHDIDRAALRRTGELVIPFGGDLMPVYVARGQAALCDGGSEQVHVAAWQLVDGRPRVSAGWTAIAAGSGSFALRLEPDHDYAIVACAPDTAPQTRFVTTVGDLNIDVPTFQLERGVSISGRVDLGRHSFGGAAWLCAADYSNPLLLDVAGTELAWNGAAFERRTCSAQAGPDGTFTLSGLARGRYSLRLGTTRTWAPADATFQAYAPSSDIVLAPPLVHVTLKLELERAPLPEHELRVHGVGECSARATPVMISDVLGRAELWLLPGEQYVVDVPMSERDTRSYGKIVPWNRGEVVEVVSMSAH